MSDIQSFTQFLQNYHDEVFACEARAQEAIAASDNDGFRAHMREKAVKMSQISEAAAPWLERLEGEVKDKVRRRLHQFSFSATQGLKLNSPFYWSALLWDENADPKTPDNLQLFINELKGEE